MICERAVQLIADCEGCASTPMWPGGASGVTIGIGYDLGYTSIMHLLHDWSAYYSAEQLTALTFACGVQGAPAQELLPRYRDFSPLPRTAARAVFISDSLPRYEEQTRQAFPGCEALGENVFGALVSLVYNRGVSMIGERRREMRTIRSCVASADIPGIAQALRDMKRLWVGKGLDGLIARREAEAQLVELG